MAHICCTLFDRCLPDELTAHYEAYAEPANGYLIRLQHWSLLVDAVATETANWVRQCELSAEMTCEDGVAVSLFLVDRYWAIAVAAGGKRRAFAAYMPDDPKLFERLPNELHKVEQALALYFPDDIDIVRVDELFGAIIDNGITVEDGFLALTDLLGISPEWLRWSWYETIPEQLFTDPDLAPRVKALGDAKQLWEE